MTPTDNFTSTPAPGRRAAAMRRSWLPAQYAIPRPHDISYWRSRAARGHSWNSAAITRRNP